MLFTVTIGQSADIFGYNSLFVALGAPDIVAATGLWSLLPSSRQPIMAGDA